MSISKTPLDSRIFATQPAATHALAIELRRNSGAATTKAPLVSTLLGAHCSLLSGRRRQDCAVHLDLAAWTSRGPSNTCRQP